MVMTASEMIEEVLERTGILEAYRQENTLEAQSRIENIKELLSVAIELKMKARKRALRIFLPMCPWFRMSIRWMKTVNMLLL